MTHRERQLHRKRRRRHHGARGKLLLVLAGLTAITVTAALSVLGYVVSVLGSAPSIDSLKPIRLGSSSVVYAVGGERMGFIQASELRSPVPQSSIPQSLRDATIAIEDERFYRHKGVDYEGVLRAAIKNLRSGKTVQGGSTLTMQLVQQLYVGKERSFERKLREAKLASELEDQRSKGWILNQYVNSVPYGTVGGQTTVGVQAAARTFFDKPAAALELHESALLAGLPQAPSLYNPITNPDAALRRRNTVLRKMREGGSITAEQAAGAAARPLGIERGRFYTARREQYFFDYVKEELIRGYGINQVRKGGLKIYTTVDVEMQRAARRAIAGRLGLPGDPQAAVVTIDPSTGYIRTMASSSSYGRRKFNLAAQGRRQAGSTFKTMVLMAALRRGVDPDTTYYTSRPFEIVAGQPWGPWKVETYGRSYGGAMNLVTATLKSDNTVYAQLDLDLGPESVAEAARDMGITSKLNGYPAEGLGGLELGVSPLEMANAYATIAGGGVRSKPIAIRRVVHPDGTVDDLGQPKRARAFDEGVAYEATEILRRNILGGTGTRANVGCPAAGKTGTVDDFTDAWFVGFTPKLATSVWVGFPDSKVPMTNIHGIAVNGGSIPAEIWGDYMRVAKGAECPDFERPVTPAILRPFFGRYATTGQPVTPPKEDEKADKGKRKATRDGGTKFDPRAYEAPPRSAPEPPAEQPAEDDPGAAGGAPVPTG